MRRLNLILLAFLVSFPATAFSEGKKVKIPAGNATVGTDNADLKLQLTNPRAKAEWFLDETPKKSVDIGGFYLDETEVTNTDFIKIFPQHIFPFNLADHPAVNVTWGQADSYCRKSDGRLPTEEEWERAARGDNGTIYPWGDSFEPDNAVFGSKGSMGNETKVGSFKREESGSTLLGGTSTVGSRANGRSANGIHDMAGNVWEWVDGWYDKEKNLRLLKGGSWLSPKESLRSAAKLGDTPNSRFNDYGFRCAYNID
jgi:iron(II)-dependent oxidoreductase